MWTSAHISGDAIRPRVTWLPIYGCVPVITANGHPSNARNMSLQKRSKTAHFYMSRHSFVQVDPEGAEGQAAPAGFEGGNSGVHHDASGAGTGTGNHPSVAHNGAGMRNDTCVAVCIG